MLREIIFKILNDNHYSPMNYQQLATIILRNTDEFDLNMIYKELVLLENEHLIMRVKHDNIQSIARLGLKLGIIEIKAKGFGFVKVDDDTPDIFVSRKNINGAIEKDLVLVEITDEKKHEGIVYKVIEHKLGLIVGVLHSRKNNTLVVIPDNKNLNFEIKINNKHTLGANTGYKVVCYITDVDQKHGLIYGKIKHVIGHMDAVDIDVISIVYEYGFEVDFSKTALHEAKQAQSKLISNKGRKDLRSLAFITIDGADAKDLDDAIYVERDQDNNYDLYVSIADVSYYVEEKSTLDQEAYLRSTSVYLTNKVVPMLPFQISNEVCSLQPDVDRLTMTAQMKINEQGQLLDYQIYESIINSKHRLTYDQVNQFYNNNQKQLNNLKDINEMLWDMLSLSKIIRDQKIKNGYINFNIAEPKIILNSKGKAINVINRDRGLAEMMIEDFMVRANEVVAEHFYWLDVPFLYRVHDKPNMDRLSDLVIFAKSLNINYHLNKDNVTSHDINHFLDKININQETHFLDKLLLRTMAKACYQPDNIGHFGLASPYYTHFTSPIRRYADLIVHRLIKTYQNPKILNDEKILNKKYEKLVTIGEHISKKERDAIDAERRVDDIKMAEYMSDYLGEVFEGTISSITSFGFFVSLDNSVEGLVHISTLKDQNYLFDKDYHCLRGQRTNVIYRMGDQLKVRLIRASIKEGKIDFELFK
ncbi:MAG: ribonuclease R [Bacilli bacterium]|nr:ribonuclease R [Bacilli bacterium]